MTKWPRRIVWALSANYEKVKLKKKPSARQIFTTIAILMWATSFLANLLNPKYNPPDYVNPLIMLVGGYLFATSTKEPK